ncbi:MAG TPA: DUF4157 domain-containing protein [Bryobacteraceae bacterium]|nr:DUF4157 domain-containing protein [Bryobacteraceae bacterium]HZW94007.1 DUF4157 domain-containing protein [Candidatus Eremiobacteraceae bacterium]
MPQQFMIGEHRRGANPAPATSSIAIPARVVQHTVQQLVVQGRKLVSNLSHVRMFESHEATRMGLPAFARGAEIHFAPGAFQPHSQSGRQLIEQQLTALVPLTPVGPTPVPVPYPNLSSASQPAPFTSNVMVNMIPGASLPAPPSSGVMGSPAPSMMKPVIGGHRL